ncbi:MAG TPA: hypothetical protein PKG88_06600 [Bacteroidales bacterium]|jgi:hypothetical protein|nr:hypothetical protein [Bacteroidales bacterium]HPS71933.1 hypothetical protein [Bacteroidales bacterium]
MPQQSQKAFISPSGVPIKKTPSIVDIVEDKTIKEVESNIKKEVEPIQQVQVVPEIIEVKEEIPKNETEVDLPIDEEEELVSVEISTPQEVDLSLFPKYWNEMFETVFKDIPTIYYPLKEYVPTIQDNVIEINLKNDLQKDHFDPKIREVLAYLRTNFNDAIEDIVVRVDESVVTRKVIYDTADKMKNLAEQNPSFEDFNAILDLRVKE